jgi:branched-subunit amino acid transport protein AzlD
MAVRRPTAVWALLTIAYLAFACLYNALIPLGYGPDEAHHYGYIQHLVLYRSLPVLGPQDHPILCHRDPRPPMAIGIHPPLYYALLAPIYALIAGRRIDYPAEAARKTPFPLLPRLRSELVQRLLRSISLLMGLLTLLCLSRLVALLTDDAWRQFAVVGFVALLPHFLMLGAVMNNDNLAVLTGTFVFAVAPSANHLPVRTVAGSDAIGFRQWGDVAEQSVAFGVAATAFLWRMAIGASPPDRCAMAGVASHPRHPRLAFRLVVCPLLPALRTHHAHRPVDL